MVHKKVSDSQDLRSQKQEKGLLSMQRNKII